MTDWEKTGLKYLTTYYDLPQPQPINFENVILNIPLRYIEIRGDKRMPNWDKYIADYINLGDQSMSNYCDFKPLQDYHHQIVEEIRGAGNALIDLIINNTKQSREQSLAITNIEQGIMWAIKGISRNG